MKLRTFGISTLLVALFVTTVVALRAADEKPKGKAKEAEDPGIVKFTASPVAVQKTFKDEVRGGKIELLGKGLNDKGIVFYKALIGIGGNDYEVAVGEDGRLLEKILQLVNSDVESIDDCPAPVKKTLSEEGKGAKVEAIEKVAEGKRTHFVIDVVLQKSKYQIIIMDDGTLLSKVIDYDKDADSVPAPAEAKSKTSGTRKN